MFTESQVVLAQSMARDIYDQVCDEDDGPVCFAGLVLAIALDLKAHAIGHPSSVLADEPTGDPAWLNGAWPHERWLLKMAAT